MTTTNKFVKAFGVLAIASITLGSFSSVNAYAANESNSQAVCTKVKQMDITFAQKRDALRIKQAQDRLTYVNNRITLAQSKGKDVLALQDIVPDLQTKVVSVKTSYQAWIDSANDVDCSTPETAKATRQARDKAHDDAWRTFVDLINYYNKTIRPIYRQIAAEKGTTPTAQKSN